MSKVIHARIRTSTIVACYELLQMNGLSTAGTAMSTVVSKALEAMIDGLAREGHIDRVDEQMAETALLQYLSDTGPSVPTVAAPTQLSFGEVEEEREEPVERYEETSTPPEEAEMLYDTRTAEDAVKEILEAAARHTTERKGEDFDREDTSDEPEPEVPLSPTPPWEEEGVIDWETLNDECQDDDIMKLATDARPAYQRTVQVVYSKIPREMRGTKKAVELIEQTLPIVSRYIEAGYV